MLKGSRMHILFWFLSWNILRPNYISNFWMLRILEQKYPSFCICEIWTKSVEKALIFHWIQNSHKFTYWMMSEHPGFEHISQLSNQSFYFLNLSHLDLIIGETSHIKGNEHCWISHISYPIYRSKTIIIIPPSMWTVILDVKWK